MIRRGLVVGIVAIGLLTGCGKSPSGIYASTGKVLGHEITHEADFRADGTCYYKGAFDDSPHQHTWSKSGSTIEIRNGSEVVEKLVWDGSDLVPVSDAKVRRFVKR